ncbi:MAG: ECF transporter S component [Lachnospiraceae bacterium]|nr:ECF transporter S component [Lachnospiraceae bacterium]
MSRTAYEGIEAISHKKRTIAATVIIILLMPFTLYAGVFWLKNTGYIFLSLLIAFYTMLPFFMIFEKRKPKAREIVLIAMMIAIIVMAHLVFHMMGGVSIGTALVVVAGISFGPEAGFLIGAISRFVLNFYQGQGAWTPWQMVSWGLLAFLAGFVFNKLEQDELKLSGNFRKEKMKSEHFRMVLGPLVCVFITEVLAFCTYLLWPNGEGSFFGYRVYLAGLMGLGLGAVLQRKKLPIDQITLTVYTFFSVLFIYGGIMNVATMFTSMAAPGSMGLSLETLKVYYVSGLPYDLTHAAMASVCVFLFGKPIIRKIERIKIKYGIYR